MMDTVWWDTQWVGFVLITLAGGWAVASCYLVIEKKWSIYEGVLAGLFFPVVIAMTARPKPKHYKVAVGIALLPLFPIIGAWQLHRRWRRRRKNQNSIPQARAKKGAV